MYGLDVRRYKSVEKLYSICECGGICRVSMHMRRDGEVAGSVHTSQAGNRGGVAVSLQNISNISIDRPDKLT
jgi:hypothetical protein